MYLIESFGTDNDAISLDLPNQERGNKLERLKNKIHIINRMIMDACIVGLARH